MTIQQFIKAARKLPNRIVLEHAIVFHEAIENGGFIYRGQHNHTMRHLRRLNLFQLDPSSTTGRGEIYKPCWHITQAGLALTRPQEKTP